MSRPLRLYLALAPLVALGVWWWLAVAAPGERRPASVALLVLIFGLGVLAYQFPVQLGRSRKAHVGSSLLLAGAFLFSPAEAMALAGVTALAGNALLRLPVLPRPVQRRRWYNWVFNGAQVSLGIGLAGLTYQQLARDGASFAPAAPAAAVGLVAASLVAYIVTTAAVAGIIGVQQRANPLPIWLEGRRHDWREEAGLAFLAIVTALVAERYPWALLLQAGAMAVVYLSFKQSAQVRRQTQATIEHLAMLVDHRDPYTFRHSQNVSQYAVMLAEDLALPASQVELIRTAALVHDIGKITVPDAVLLKPGRLTDAEWQQMRRHPVAGAEMVAKLPEYAGGLKLILHHHEAWDGRGYPAGLAGEEIPLGARVIAVADSYDAMATARPYRSPLPREAIVEQFRQGRGRQWDPRLVDLWLDRLDSLDANPSAGHTTLTLVSRTA